MGQLLDGVTTMKRLIFIVSIVILLSGTAHAKILIDELTVIDDSMQLTMLGNLARSVSDSMADKPLVVTVCYSDINREICASYIGGEATYSFDIYERNE